jgi:NADH-quinone oxidoreductase subunit D
MADDRIKSREAHSAEIRKSVEEGFELGPGSVPPPEGFLGGAEAARLPTEEMIVNVGPSHPATHGTVRFLMKLDGENIVDMDADIGYLHRGFEKQCENATWTQVFPYTDRLNYVSPLCNNVGYAMAVEKLAGIDDPPRSKYIRVIGAEIHRVCDHLTAIAATALELGAFSAFLYAVEARELFWDRVAELTGARMTVSYCRIGGVARDAPEGWFDKLHKSIDRTRGIVNELDGMLSRNRIFVDRMQGTGVISREDAIAYGWTGPCLRSVGVDYDVRKDHPYLVYGDLDFDVPVGAHGDNYDRYLVRVEEIRQSLRIIEQCIAKMPSGPVIVDDWKYALPPKKEVYETIEGAIAHFEIIMYGIQVPKGEAYGYTEAANGELGFYVVSDGGGQPYKIKVRPPCFAIMQSLPKMMRGALLADLVPTFDSINMIGGEIDR